MAEDVTDDFDVDTSIDLPGGMAVPKGMCADYFGRDSSQTRIEPNTVSNGTAGHRLIRHIFSEEKVFD